MSHRLAHHGSIFLLDMALIVLDRRASARKGEVFLLTIGDQFLIEELRAAIGVNAQQGKREELAGLLERSEHRIGALFQQWDALGPAGGEIGQRQGVQKVPSEMLPTMGYQIHFYKAWAILLPLRIGTHRDLGLAPGPRRSGRQAMRVGFALRAQEALRRGQTHGEHQAALFFCELQVPVLFQQRHQPRQ